MAKSDRETSPQKKQRRYSPEVRRQMILDAATTLFRSTPDATIDDVAREAGVTRQLVGQYFPGGGVERIQAELMERATLGFVEQLLSNDHPPPETLEEWREVIVQTTRKHFEWAVALDMPWLFAGEASGLPAAVGVERRKVLESAIPLVMAWAASVLADTETNRLLVVMEYRAIDELIWLVTTGQLGIDEAVSITVARWQGLVEHAAPLLKSAPTG